MYDEQSCHALLTDYLRDRDVYTRVRARSESAAVTDKERSYAKAVASVKMDAVSRARQEVGCKPSVPLTVETQQQVLSLTAMQVPEPEKAKLQTLLADHVPNLKRAKLPAKRAIKRKVCSPSFKTGSAPGPSGIRNAYIKALALQPGGIDALFGWMRIQARAMWLADDHDMWNAAVLTPVDCGEAKVSEDEPLHEQLLRKLRPLAQSETIVKLLEKAHHR